MQIHDKLIKHFHAERWFYLFITLHLVLWTAVPAIVRYNLPLDSIEGTVWGHQLEWGYDKNPFLNGWLTAFATYLDGHTGWMVYLFSQISVVACFWAVWRLANKMLPSLYALAAVMILEGIQYYNLHAIDFNDNTLELGLWALAALYFYQALKNPSGKYTSWILTGLFAAFGMMAKYYTAALLAGMALFLFLDRDNRKQLATLAPYIGLSVFLMIILPHVIWLFSHDFITVTYVFERASSTPVWTNHLFFPTQFAWQQIQAFLPALVLFSILLIGKKPRLASQSAKLTNFDKDFLFYVGLGPFLLTVLLSILLGIKLRAGWGMPLLSLWGIILLGALPPRLTETKIRCFLAAIFTVMCLVLGGYSASLIHSSSPSSANFPGREIAQTLTRQWRDTYHSPLAYVAGSRWIGGNIEFYSTDHPAVFTEWDQRRAFWIDANELRRKGAMFVWDVSDGETLPAEIQQQFPHLQQMTVMEFPWHRNRSHLEPVKIGVAILPPANS
jgi:4-amino-4-deoxy-L-arabinose transferase-like glycosyltransferase